MCKAKVIGRGHETQTHSADQPSESGDKKNRPGCLETLRRTIGRRQSVYFGSQQKRKARDSKTLSIKIHGAHRPGSHARRQVASERKTPRNPALRVRRRDGVFACCFRATPITDGISVYASKEIQGRRSGRIHRKTSEDRERAQTSEGSLTGEKQALSAVLDVT